MFVLVRLGDTERAEQALAGTEEMEERERERGDIRVATAALRLAQDDPPAAAAVLAPVLDGSASELPWSWLTFAFLLEASARDALGDQGAAARALERALDLAEPDGALLWFLLHPVPALLERQVRHRTVHAALIAEILGLLARPGPGPGGTGGGQPPVKRGGLGGSSPRLIEPLSGSELRVLRYLPTNLTTPEIAAELYVSRNTVKTHVRSLYLKLGTHRRAEAVEFARDLGLLAPSAHSPR
jgi:LuxR family maltose regulon positive regulatory protein